MAGIENNNTFGLSPTGVLPGQYSNLNVDFFGRITGIRDLIAQDIVNALGFSPSADSLGYTPNKPSVCGIYYLDNYPLLQGETTHDNAFARLLSDMADSCGKIVVGPHVYYFNSTIALPVGVSLESGAGHSGSFDLPINTRPYTFILTPGAQYLYPANTKLYGGSIVLNEGCSVRGLTIVSAAAAAIVGNGITNPIAAEQLRAMMSNPSSGIGIASLADDAIISDVAILGFNVGILHDTAGANSTHGMRPTFMNIKTHCQTGIVMAGADTGVILNHRHSPYLVDDVFSNSVDKWQISIRSDGASGSNIGIINGQSFISIIDGQQVAICLQADVSGTPSPSGSNYGVNRFGDNFYRNAVWKLVDGVFVINLPDCPPESFAVSPSFMSLVGCGDSGIGLMMDESSNVAVIGCEYNRAQNAIVLNNSVNNSFSGCRVMHDKTIADMSAVGISIQNASWQCSFQSGSIEGYYLPIYHNVSIDHVLGTDGGGYTRFSSFSTSSQPVGGLILNRVSGGLQFDGCHFETSSIISSLLPVEKLCFTGACHFSPLAKTKMSINNQSVLPSNVFFDNGCINVPDWTYARPLGQLVETSTNFVPTITFTIPGDLTVSYTQQTGNIYQIGKLVFVSINLSFLPIYSSASGLFWVLGLPIAASLTNANASLTVTTTYATLAATVSAGSNNIVINDGVMLATTDQFPDGKPYTITIAGTYLAQ